MTTAHPRFFRSLLAGVSPLLMAGCLHQGVAPLAPLPPPTAKATGPLDFTLRANDGSAHDLGQYKGQVVLLVNTASNCGFTKQYTSLENLYQAHKAQGLVIIAIPSNDFLSQEPGGDEEIKTFCSTKYPITFPLMAKTVVRGDGLNPLYAYLTKESPFPGSIGWNFTKFLVGRDGKVLARFGPSTDPLEAEVTQAVEKALAERK